MVVSLRVVLYKHRPLVSVQLLLSVSFVDLYFICCPITFSHTYGILKALKFDV